MPTPPPPPPPPHNPPINNQDLGHFFDVIGNAVGAYGTAVASGARLPTISVPQRAEISLLLMGLGEGLKAMGIVGEDLGGPIGSPTYIPPGAGIEETIAKAIANISAEALIGASIPISAFAEVADDLARWMLRFIAADAALIPVLPELIGAILMFAALMGAAEIGENALAWLMHLFDFSFSAVDPLVLDLDGNGVQLLSLEATNIHFDLNQDGFAEHVGWVSAGDGFLVRDLNANGLIDNGSELLGNASATGFSILAAHDDNLDGIINSSDAIFSELQVWRDLNLDGVTQAGELGSLSSFGVVSITLASTPEGWWVQRAGNTVLASGSYTNISGMQEALAVNLNADQADTHFILPEGFQFDPEVIGLPNLRGYGQVPDLWVAMSLDPTLKAMVQALVADAGDFTSVEDLIGAPYAMMLPGGMFYGYGFDDFEPMLARWAGVDDDAFERLQAEDIAEAFMGRQADHALNNPYFYEAFQEFAMQMAVRFYIQVAQAASVEAWQGYIEAVMNAVPADGIALTPEEVNTIGAPYLAIINDWNSANPGLEQYAHLSYNLLTDGIEGNVGAFIDHLLEDYDFDAGDPWDGYDGWHADHAMILSIVDPEGVRLHDRHRAYTGNVDLDILRYAHVTVEGTSGADTLAGDGGALTSNDLMIGGAGDDTLSGGAGNDTYLFTSGSGSDLVADTSGSDEVAFQGPFLRTGARFTFANSGYEDLLISFDGRDETVEVTGYFDDIGAATIETISFADGIVDVEDIRDAVLASRATSGADEIIGFSLSSTLIGLAGNDHLVGRNGDDIILGGTGDDILSGSGGNDTYRFSPGDGADIIREDSSVWNGRGGTDTIELLGILPEDVVVTQTNFGTNIVLTIGDDGDSITLEGSVNDYYQRVEQVVFTDQTIWTFADLMAMALAPTSGNDTFWGSYDVEVIEGGAGDDVIDARGGADIIIGGTGNDLLSGSGGNDIYRFQLGDGQDIVRDDISAFSGLGGYDIVAFAEGIDAGDIIVTQANFGQDLVLAIAGTTDTIILYHSVTEPYQRIEQVRFFDDTTWTHEDLMAMALAPTSGNDTFWGGYDSETIEGGAGNDVIDARGGNDILIGGLGNDTLSGSGGDDTYLFNLGDGQDVINEDVSAFSGVGGFDILQFGTGIGPGDIVVTKANGGNDLVLTISGTTDSITIQGGVTNPYDYVEAVHFADGTVWTRTDMLSLSVGATAGNDTIYGDNGSNFLGGLAGNDILYARPGDDVLHGGLGNDVLHGEGGSDTYRFGLGDGQDVVQDYGDGWGGYGGTDTIEFGPGIDPADVIVTQVGGGGDFVLAIAGTSDRVTLAASIYDGNNRIERVTFADGTVWTHADLMIFSTASNGGNDAFYGGYDADTLSGGAGNDRLDGRQGNDLLIGGLGNDLLIGSSGDDTYRFGLGDGQDVVQDYGDWWNGSGGADTVELGSGITTADILVSQGNNGGDIILAIAGTSDRITLSDTVNDSNYRIEHVTFVDGTTWTHADLMTRATTPTSGNDSFYGGYDSDTLAGGAGNDTLDGRRGNDILIGGAGNDLLIGSEGNDTYRFGIGDGQDIVQEYGQWWNGSGGTDVVELGAGITAADITVGTADSGGSYILYLNGGEDRLTLTGAATWGADWAIETIRFSDGSTWTGASLAGRVSNSSMSGETILGTASNDLRHGLGGDDTLSGRGGDDILFGDAGNDTLIGDGLAPTGSNLIVNGSFETSGTIVASGSWGKANSTLPGWTKTNSQPFEQVASGHAGVYSTDGSYWFDTDSAGGSGSNMDISQTIGSLTAGHVMLLQFDHANTTSAASGAFEVYWNGTLIASISETGATMRTKTYELVAVDGDNVLRFVGLGSAENSGSAIDNVRLYETEGVSGADTLYGGAGDDTLIGGAGADQLTGGTGVDIFKYAAGDSPTGGADRITDFLSGTDKIDLSAIDADSGATGNQAFNFIGNSAFSATAGELRYNVNGGDTVLKADLDGDGAADITIILSGFVTPLASDFVL